MIELEFNKKGFLKASIFAFLLVMVFSSLVNPALASAPYVSDSGDELSNTKILAGKERSNYIKIAEKSNVFKNVIKNNFNNKPVKLGKDSLVQEVTTTQNEIYSKLVIISATEKNNKLNEFQIFINPETNEVVRLLVSKLTGETSKDVLSYYDYDEDGNLRVKAKGTLEEVENGEIEFVETGIPVDSNKISPRAVPDKYIYWACRFSGFLACQTATLACGPAKFLCNLACSYAFKKAACDRYK